MQGKRDRKISWTAIAGGSFLGIMTSVLLAAGLATAQMNHWIDDKGVRIAVVGIQVFGAFVGAIYAKGMAPGGAVLTCMMAGAGYCTCLVVITAIFFGAQYQGVLAPCLFALGIATSVGLLGKRRQGIRKKRVNYKGFSLP